MNSRRMYLIVLVALMVLLGGPLGYAWADKDDDDRGREMEIAGFVDVPGSGSGATLQLPLAAGAAPVVVNLTFGIPSVTIPVTITPATRIKPASEPITLTDGDRIKVDMHVVGSVLQADRIQVEDFPELELIGTAKGLPAAGVTLPLAAGTTLNFVLTLGASGVDVPVTLTAGTKIKAHTVAIHNGDPLRIEAGVRNNTIRVTEISRIPSL
jgi:uncharacterized protein DUF5666